MPSDFYGTESSGPEAKEPEMEESGEETALVPKSFLGGNCKEGDTYKVKVGGLYDDEVELELVKEEKKEEPSEPDVEARMMKMAE
jgi:hypothetical protein